MDAADPKFQCIKYSWEAVLSVDPEELAQLATTVDHAAPFVAAAWDGHLLDALHAKMLIVNERLSLLYRVSSMAIPDKEAKASHSQSAFWREERQEDGRPTPPPQMALHDRQWWQVGLAPRDLRTELPPMSILYTETWGPQHPSHQPAWGFITPNVFDNRLVSIAQVLIFEKK
eukprot:TRINITY_DN21574_c0_g1_i1.p1 TRINITY_DN21574_c0_g1~~TRINITY_DN21574_c0_g1_i1.p1  ORF type:complete len:173 (+),score=8.03 TRINITY_DN21574_c0_g1_i1:179-697(+)